MKSDVPPKQPVNGTEAIRMDDEDTPFSRFPGNDMPHAGQYGEASALVALQSGSPLGNSSFPVLKAFQDYLEAERVRSRQRTAMLTCIFAAIIVVILVTFGLIWHSVDRNSREREAMLWQVAIANKESPAVKAESPEEKPAENTSELVAAAVAKAQADQAALFSEKFETMTKLIETVQNDNIQLKKALAKKSAAGKSVQAAPTRASAPVAKRHPAHATKQAPAVKKIARKQPVAKPAPVLVVPTVPPPPTPDGFASGSLGVRIPKEPNPLPWRIYMPMK